MNTILLFLSLLPIKDRIRPDEVAILPKGLVNIGMTRGQVLKTLGIPKDVDTDEWGDLWSYWGETSPCNGRVCFVYFTRQGHVEKLKYIKPQHISLGGDHEN